MRKKDNRQQRILNELSNSPAVRVGELAERLGVTTETIRRDLKLLTAQGLLARTYGGATKSSMSEPAIMERHTLFVEERRLIARCTLDLIRNGKTLYIGSGATTTHVSHRIAVEMKNITVFTHAFGVATALSINPTIQVFFLPGLYHAQEGSTYGAQALRAIESVHADFAIVGASGFMRDGPNEALPDMAEVYAAMIRRSNFSLVVADHSKVMRRFTTRFATWREIDAFVTDRPLPDTLHKDIAQAGVTIVDQATP